MRLATTVDRDRVVATVVAAFAQEPAFHYFFADQDAYAAQAPVLVGHLFDQRVPHDGVWVVEDGAALAMWERPGGSSGDLTDGLSPDTVARMEQYNTVVHDLLPQAPHWYLGVLATHPDHAGKRYGRLAMAEGLARARSDGLPAYLETTRQVNVDIYAASGWRVVGTVPFGTFEVSVMEHTGV